MGKTWGGSASDLDIAVRISECLTRLPAVATPDWCDQAATCLAGLAPASISCVLVVDLEGGSTVREVEAVGVCSTVPGVAGTRITALRARAERLERLGWKSGRPGPTLPGRTPAEANGTGNGQTSGPSGTPGEGEPVEVKARAKARHTPGEVPSIPPGTISPLAPSASMDRAWANSSEAKSGEPIDPVGGLVDANEVRPIADHTLGGVLSQGAGGPGEGRGMALGAAGGSGEPGTGVGRGGPALEPVAASPEILCDALDTLVAPTPWTSSPLGEVLGETHPSCPLVGLFSLGRSLQQGRIMISLVAPSLETGPPGDTSLRVMRAVLPIFRKRARLALAGGSEAKGRWLTSRECEVLEMLTLGRSVRQIADEIQRSPHTVHDHVKALHRKLNASTRGELISRALGSTSLLGGRGEQPASSAECFSAAAAAGEIEVHSARAQRPAHSTVQ